MELGGPTILGKPIMEYLFCKETHYGKIIDQHVELVYQGICDTKT
jgi:hypothetical protein